MAADSESGTDDNMIELVDEVEGVPVESVDYFFHKIGESVPLKSGDSKFDLQSLPAQPLALSQRFQLIFVAHSAGFCVARTKDVIESAKEIKEKGSGSSIQELSVVDVPIGKVYILALSSDSSTLAASIAGEIHFFSVASLLNKEQKSSFSCSLNGSSCVKDMQWIKKLENSYVVLSSHGRLYHGTAQGPLNHVMDNVDAVEWSVKGNFVAVARSNILSILSSSFKERLCMSLSFKSWIDDSDVNRNIKVDSIRWVRPDCIILGCFQVTADGEEENYLVQVITSKDGNITDASSKPVVLYFSDLFPGFIDDIVPFGSGPHLFLGYIKQCELAVTANRKNTDQHIALFGWSLDDEKNEVAVIDIARDDWLPRIELQENGDDNVILGLCVDKVSLHEKVKIKLGVEEERELSPYCVLLCLTLEGKLIMFHVSSVTGTPVPPQFVSALSDEEEDTPAVLPLEYGLSKISSGLEEQRVEQVVLGFQSQEVNKKELNTEGGGEIPVKSDLKPSQVNRPLMSVCVADQISFKETITENQEVEAFVNSQTFEADEQQKVPVIKLNQDKGGQQSWLSGQQSTNVEQSSLKTSHQEGPSPVVGDFSKTETQKIAGVGPSTDTFVGKTLTDMSGQSNCKDSQKGVEVGKGKPGKIGPTSLQSASSQPWSSGGLIFSKDSDAGSSTGAGNIKPLPAISSSQLSLQENFALGKSPNYRFHPTKETFRTPPLPRLPNSESNLSKEFGNVKEMAKELDTLLECIEEAGGFRDTCIVFQKSSVVALEEGIGTLSDRCRMWRSIMDERLGEIQHLLDKAVQVLARKIYMEGIVKQATDSRYWDLWNRQKLSSELELKRRHILKVKQDLTNQLIELERHFNTLEFNKFGENGGAHMGRRAFQSKYGPSRNIRSLHSLHNTMISQLAAAEKLSECLSKQMAVLSIESPSLKQQGVKKELFETIGIPYDGASFSSPDVTKASDTSSIQRLLFSSCSAVIKDQSRRNQSSAMESYEPETARRRRDSLDRSWASFEPPKTTVKRMLLQEEHQKVSAKRSSLLMDKQHFSPHVLEGSAVARPRDRTTPSNFLYSFGNKGIQDTQRKQASDSPSTSLSRRANDLPGPSQSIGSKSPAMKVLPRNNLSAFSWQSVSQSSSIVGQNSAGETCDLSAERPSRGVNYIEKSGYASIYETEPPFQSETHLRQTPSISMTLPTHKLSSSKKSSEMLNLNNEETMLTKSTIGSVKHWPITTESSLFESGKIRDSPFSPMSAVPPAPSLPGKVFEFDTAKSKSQPGEIVSSMPIFSISFSAQSSSLMINSSSTPSSSLPTPSIASTLLSAMSLSSKSTIDADPTSEVSTGLASGSQLGFNAIANPISDVALNAQPEKPSAAHILFPAPLSTSGSTTGGKNESSDVSVSQEDEMEEEAPETSHTTELSLGSLGGFGIGSAPNPTAPKQNPFGGPFANATANPASSPFTMMVPSGELFRPASFSFQSPQPSQPSQPTNLGAFSGGFGTGNTVQVPTVTGFGQAAQIGQGQQALGSVLGAFGQSRQLGAGLPGSSFASGSSFGSGFAGTQSTGGFPNAATGGGFTGVSSTGGFSGLASAGGGFASVGSGGGGFAGVATAGGGFARAASGGGFPVAGGGFGALSNQQGSGDFSTFGSGGGGTGKPVSQLFTQIRK